MPEITIRKATHRDLDTLLRFEQGIIATERPFDKTLKPGHIHYYDLEAMIHASDVEVLVAQVNDEVIGSGYARIETAKPYLNHRQYAYLGFMFVEPAYRGQGVNQKIIKALTQWAVAQNINEIRLDVYADNIAAIKAYEKAGFVPHLLQMRMQ